MTMPDGLARIRTQIRSIIIANVRPGRHHAHKYGESGLVFNESTDPGRDGNGWKVIVDWSSVPEGTRAQERWLAGRGLPGQAGRGKSAS